MICKKGTALKSSTNIISANFCLWQWRQTTNVTPLEKEKLLSPGSRGSDNNGQELSVFIQVN